MVARPQRALDGQIERVRAVEGKGHAKGIARPKHGGDRLPGGEYRAGGLQRAAMPRAPRIGVEAGQGGAHGRQNALRLRMAGSRVVEIDVPFLHSLTLRREQA